MCERSFSAKTRSGTSLSVLNIDSHNEIIEQFSDKSTAIVFFFYIMRIPQPVTIRPRTTDARVNEHDNIV